MWCQGLNILYVPDTIMLPIYTTLLSNETRSSYKKLSANNNENKNC